MAFNDEAGVPLAQLDTSGPAPDEIALNGPDRVIVTRGDTFTVSVDGGEQSADNLRFALEDGSLVISRVMELRAHEMATIRVMLPAAPQHLTLAGSGVMTSDSLAAIAEITVAGSGNLATPRIDADTLEVTIAGSGTYRGAGRARSLALNVAGSGEALLDGLSVDNADVSIAGSGNAAFLSDGTVDASIMGSGNVRVTGKARCTVEAMGSGSLVCERAGQPV